MKLKNKVAIVTGAASGQGRAIARLYAREGAYVVAADLNLAGAEETAREAAAHGGAEMLPVQVDISDEDAVRAMVKQAVDTFDGLDILVNCAGITAPVGKETADLLTREEWYRVLDVNLIGPWLAVKYAVPAMKERGGGVIINVSSTAGLRPFPGAAPYTVSKAGLLMLNRTLALEYVSWGIRVMAICPGHIDTPMMDRVIADMVAAGITDAREKVHTQSNPMGRLARPEEVAAVALFLASDDASFLTGSAIMADGGYMAG